MLPSVTYLELDSCLRGTAIFAHMACYISCNAHQQTDLARNVVTHTGTSRYQNQDILARIPEGLVPVTSY